MSVSHIKPATKSLKNSNAPFHIVLCKPELISNYHSDQVISAINYGSADAADPNSLAIELEQLSPDSLCELWIARDKLTSGREGDIKFRKNNELLFGKISLDENSFDNLEDCSNYAYSSILNFIHKKEFPNIIRMWNYFPKITKNENTIERYQSFCIGRYNGFKHIAEFERQLPAATAIGTQKGRFTVYFLATTKAGVQVENPRQISAYHYPEQYSPKSPSFARATLKHWPSTTQFFISGTASIVGHETLHEENVLIQLEEILKNIEALVETVRDTHQQPIRDITGLSLMKVYIRHPEHFTMIKEALSQRIGKNVSVIYLQGDICRANLLLEIEAYAELGTEN